LILAAPFRRALLGWYDRVKRDLPWRSSPDFYRVWVSEIMLQQTRVEAVIPYYRRFLERFPSVKSLAAAPDTEVLARWSGLGYYSRARNLHRAAQQIASQGLPRTYDEVRALAGVGPYTAAAISSIALRLPHAAVDGNVLRLVSRLANDASEITAAATRRRFGESAAHLLDPGRPGDFNQAMMELGATVCMPRSPDCTMCPVAAFCAARAAGTERALPVKLQKQKTRAVEIHVALLERNGRIFLVQRDRGERRLAGFWELPPKDHFPETQALLTKTAEFRHQIVNDRFRVTVWHGRPRHSGRIKMVSGRWVAMRDLARLPLTTAARKALAFLPAWENQFAAAAVNQVS
jgi:A/G-specific adenine glycosylase